MTVSQKMPNANDVLIEHQKITGYLLNLEHEDGGPKARFYMAHGFTRRGWRRLANALRRHALLDVTETESVSYGVTYVIVGPFPMLDGKTANLQSIWMINHGSSVPRLITAYPVRRGGLPDVR